MDEKLKKFPVFDYPSKHETFKRHLHYHGKTISGWFRTQRDKYMNRKKPPISEKL